MLSTAQNSNAVFVERSPAGFQRRKVHLLDKKSGIGDSINPPLGRLRTMAATWPWQIVLKMTDSQNKKAEARFDVKPPRTAEA